jgi:hypothetical protein
MVSKVPRHFFCPNSKKSSLNEQRSRNFAALKETQNIKKLFYPQSRPLYGVTTMKIRAVENQLQLSPLLPLTDCELTKWDSDLSIVLLYGVLAVQVIHVRIFSWSPQCFGSVALYQSNMSSQPSSQSDAVCLPPLSIFLYLLISSLFSSFCAFSPLSMHRCLISSYVCLVHPMD